MKGDAKAIEYLNRALGNELVAINQYFLHAKMYQDWGLQALYEKEYHESIDEMKHADWLVERILFLEGIPNLQDLGKLMIGENTKEMLQCDLKLERMAIPDLREGIAYMESIQDYISRDLLKRILESEEEHVDWLETQLNLIGACFGSGQLGHVRKGHLQIDDGGRTIRIKSVGLVHVHGGQGISLPQESVARRVQSIFDEIDHHQSSAAQLVKNFGSGSEIPFPPLQLPRRNLAWIDDPAVGLLKQPLGHAGTNRLHHVLMLVPDAKIRINQNRHHFSLQIGILGGNFHHRLLLNGLADGRGKSEGRAS